ncbi:hypothetical protein FTUN_3517 [Frigoriglobus tundricola]|uniref:Uncharacterized protein n=1 Tax=Frigoriglobus tundricola TaxID=2774151 RepID=A0A6M5YRP7_9BACT|nr:hypothetical protein FTUN_3517 [Frigoriglobus tundricola]
MNYEERAGPHNQLTPHLVRKELGHRFEPGVNQKGDGFGPRNTPL